MNIWKELISKIEYKYELSLNLTLLGRAQNLRPFLFDRGNYMVEVLEKNLKYNHHK